MKKINGKFTAVPNNIITAKDITGNEFRVLCYLCRCFGTDDKCFPSLENIHRETGIGLSTVKKSIPKLVKAGYIKKSIAKNVMAALLQICIALLTKYLTVNLSVRSNCFKYEIKSKYLIIEVVDILDILATEVKEYSDYSVLKISRSNR